MKYDQIGLDDLLARDVSVQWFEGVALVQMICGQIAAQSAGDTQFPGTAQIALSHAGTVTIASATATQPVSAAGHLLARLLSEDAPVRLRLLVTQATSEDTSVGTLRELSESLAYFERPNPEGILTGLYERAMAAAPAARPQVTADVLTGEKSPTSLAEPTVKKHRSRRTAVAAAVMLVLAAAFLMRTASRNGHLAAAAAGLANVVAPSVEAPIEEAAASAAENKDSGKTATVSRGQRTTSPRGRIVPLQSAGAGEMTPDTIAVPVADSLTPDRVAELPRYDAAYEIVAHGAGSQETVYSRIDHSVSPPRQVYPALPAKPSPGIRAEDLTVLDLVISAEGVVERVRVRTPPHDVREFMLVSAAKAWRFEPATLDGRPVRFLHSVAITTD